MKFKHNIVHGKKALLNAIIDCKLSSQQYLNYEPVLKKLTNLIDNITSTCSKGQVLFGIENGLESTVMLLAHDGSSTYELYNWTKQEAIERPLNFTIYSRDYKDSINELVKEAQKVTSLGREQIVSLMLTENLNGYSLNKNKIQEYLKFIKSGIGRHTVIAGNINDIEKDLMTTIIKVKKSIKKTGTNDIDKIKKFANKLECENLNLVIKEGGLLTDRIVIGKITDIRQVANTRMCKIEWLRKTKNSTTLSTGTLVTESKVNSYNSISVQKLGDIYIAEGPKSYYSNNNDFCEEYFTRIPYNYMDVGRYFVAIERSKGNWKIIISGDPKVDENYKDTLFDVIERYNKRCISRDINLDNSKIKDGESAYCYINYINAVKKGIDTEEIKKKGIRIHMQALQKMVNEYKYIVKKHKAVGKDVFITDKIMYNHSEGKVSYGDFSIAANDELMKSRLYEEFEQYLLQYYRGENTEEKILNGLLDTFFNELRKRISQVSSDELEIPIIINDKIPVNVKVKRTKSGSNLLYLNGQRLNKNEVIVLLKEITCYRDKDEALRFIDNVSKLGLSVYIGITTGYEAKIGDTSKIYRFKKENGRSQYRLILDDLELTFKGKKIISLLYGNFIGSSVTGLSEKIEKCIFESVDSSLDYLKYKFLIDSSYESFKEKSRKFLDKKVADVEGEYCTYLPENKRKALEAIKLKGLSGNEYIVAFNSKDSFVFMNPEKEEDSDNLWVNGKYVCMVDQSSIKSNIGYDTVISKLMALKNDSMIAGTIYNLEEELNNG